MNKINSDNFVCDPREAKGGWAPGNYIGRCHACNSPFIGAKRAYICADCAHCTNKPAKYKLGTRFVLAGHRTSITEILELTAQSSVRYKLECGKPECCTVPNGLSLRCTESDIVYMLSSGVLTNPIVRSERDLTKAQCAKIKELDSTANFISNKLFHTCLSYVDLDSISNDRSLI